MPPNEPLGSGFLAMMYFGDVVFAISGALTAGRHRMDVMGFVMIGTITATGGGVIRDVLTQTRTMITCGELYATDALAGSTTYVCLAFRAASRPCRPDRVSGGFLTAGGRHRFQYKDGAAGEVYSDRQEFGGFEGGGMNSFQVKKAVVMCMHHSSPVGEC